mmetsp:Transcript_28026/g.47979  ORF Transcript_28026/g.47979 Transcript_28026/m.47979 type:complete len:215 (+) Transcript_28026:444-1088(+)
MGMKISATYPLLSGTSFSCDTPIVVSVFDNSRCVRELVMSSVSLMNSLRLCQGSACTFLSSTSFTPRWDMTIVVACSASHSCSSMPCSRISVCASAHAWLSCATAQVLMSWFCPLELLDTYCSMSDFAVAKVSKSSFRSTDNVHSNRITSTALLVFSSGISVTLSRTRASAIFTKGASRRLSRAAAHSAPESIGTLILSTFWFTTSHSCSTIGG